MKSPNQRSTKKLQVIFVGAAAITAIVLLAIWNKDPLFITYPSPGKTLIVTVGCCLFVNMFSYCANIIFTLFSVKKSKNKDAGEAALTQALNAEDYNPKVMKWSRLPSVFFFGVLVGDICAFCIYHLLVV
jgi:hypothetical protein